MVPTCADLKYVQGTLPEADKVTEDIIECLRKIFKRATGEPLAGIEVRHDVIREQGFNGSLCIHEFGVQDKRYTLIPQERSRYPRVLPGVAV